MVNTQDIDWLETTEFNGLSTKGMMLCSRFARELKRVDGRILSLRDPRLPKFISQSVRANPNPALVNIFNDLVAELEVLSEKRGQPRYRGSVTNKDVIESSNASDKGQTSSQGAPKMYRGVMVETTKTAATHSEKVKSQNTFYRGSIVK